MYLKIFARESSCCLKKRVILSDSVSLLSSSKLLNIISLNKHIIFCPTNLVSFLKNQTLLTELKKSFMRYLRQT